MPRAEERTQYVRGAGDSAAESDARALRARLKEHLPSGRILDHDHVDELRDASAVLAPLRVLRAALLEDGLRATIGRRMLQGEERAQLLAHLEALKAYSADPKATPDKRPTNPVRSYEGG